MNTPHKHAEVLRAIADGKEVQCRRIGMQECWEDLKNANPISNDYLEWRVKPEPDYFGYIGFDHTHDMATTTILRSHPPKDWNYKVKITIDGETNEPKSVELI